MSKEGFSEEVAREQRPKVSTWRCRQKSGSNKVKPGVRGSAQRSVRSTVCKEKGRR